jgi:hypothetical protein
LEPLNAPARRSTRAGGFRVRVLLAIFVTCAFVVRVRVVVPDVWELNWVSHLGWRGREMSEVIARDV